MADAVFGAAGQHHHDRRRGEPEPVRAAAVAPPKPVIDRAKVAEAPLMRAPQPKAPAPKAKARKTEG